MSPPAGTCMGAVADPPARLTGAQHDRSMSVRTGNPATARSCPDDQPEPQRDNCLYGQLSPDGQASPRGAVRDASRPRDRPAPRPYSCSSATKSGRARGSVSSPSRTAPTCSPSSMPSWQGGWLRCSNRRDDRCKSATPMKPTFLYPRPPSPRTMSIIDRPTPPGLDGNNDCRGSSRGPVTGEADHARPAHPGGLPGKLRPSQNRGGAIGAGRRPRGLRGADRGGRFRLDVVPGAEEVVRIVRRLDRP